MVCSLDGLLDDVPSVTLSIKRGFRCKDRLIRAFGNCQCCPSRLGSLAVLPFISRYHPHRLWRQTSVGPCPDEGGHHDLLAGSSTRRHQRASQSCLISSSSFRLRRENMNPREQPDCGQRPPMVLTHATQHQCPSSGRGRAGGNAPPCTGKPGRHSRVSAGFLILQETTHLDEGLKEYPFFTHLDARTLLA